jgi:SAM-dependent methyltransferase
MSEFKYTGEELNIFEQANNWKAYWTVTIRRHIGNRILEVGAGIGSNTFVLKDVECERWVCIEPDSVLCKKIEDKKRSGLLSNKIEVINGTISDIPDFEKFDTILYLDVLEHIENDSAELRVAFNLLSDNGKIIILSPAHNFLFSPFDQKIGHFRRYNKKDITEIIPEKASLLELKYFDSIGLFASLGNKLILKKADPSNAQIAFWDRAIIPISRFVDPLIAYSAGKSILAIIEKKAY